MRSLVLLPLLLLVASCDACQGDCSAHGICLNDTCACYDDYIRWPTDNLADCNYHQQNALVPFILHLFFGWFTGVGPFMLDRMDWGLASLLLCWGSVIVFCVCGCILAMTSSGRSETTETLTDSCYSCLSCVVALAVLVLYVVVLVQIRTGNMKDGNGAAIVALR